MKHIRITIKETTRPYDIIIGSNLIEKIKTLADLSDKTQIVLITDKHLWRSWQTLLINALPPKTPAIILDPGEKTKNIQTVQSIWNKLIETGCDRKSLVINVGGGVLCDMGGFAASTYMRGIDFINIPTTLLSQVDASVGGKTGIDFGGIKNLIGNFTQPKAVIIDVKTLKTLPDREYIAGFAEIIKHGLIKDKAYFEKVTSKKPRDYTEDELIEIIKKSCEIKAAVVQSDEKEIDKRKLLNFGHTIGHAVESLSLETDYPLLHGEAVSIGMVAEATIANKINLLTKEETNKIKTSLKDAGLLIKIPNYSVDKIIKKMKSDKKNVGGKINFTLLKQIGNGIINQSIPEEVLKITLSTI